jgi:hypothetical protein
LLSFRVLFVVVVGFFVGFWRGVGFLWFRVVLFIVVGFFKGVCCCGCGGAFCGGLFWFWLGYLAR